MSRITVSFSIRTSNLVPDEITRMIGVMPDSTVLRGKDRVPSTARPKDHGWILRTVSEDSDDIIGLVDNMIKRIKDISDKVIQVRESDQTCEIGFTITVRPFSINHSFLFDDNTIKTLSRIDSYLDIDFF